MTAIGWRAASAAVTSTPSSGAGTRLGLGTGVGVGTGVGLAVGDGLATGLGLGGAAEGARNDGLPPAATSPGSSDAAAEGFVVPAIIPSAMPIAIATMAMGMTTIRFNGRPRGWTGCAWSSL